MADASVRVRQAEAADVLVLVELNAHVHQPHVAEHPDVFRAVEDRLGIEDYFRSIVADPTRHVLVAELEYTVIGYVAAEVQRRPGHVFAKGNDRLYVHQISVAPAFRRRGVARALLRELQDLARRDSLGELALDTWAFNQDAQRFFEAMGFSVYNLRMWKRDLDS